MSSPVNEIRADPRKQPQRTVARTTVPRKSPLNPPVIDIKDRNQIDYWSRYFGVAPTLLCSAVIATGGVTTDVWRLLAMH